MLIRSATAVGPSLPAHASLLMRESGPQQKIRKERQAEQRQGVCLPGKMRLANSMEKKTVDGYRQNRGRRAAGHDPAARR